MKSSLFAILLFVVSASASAGTHMSTSVLGQVFTSTAVPAAVEAANRKGSTRVGGSGRSGKGGKYVGGRRK